MLGALLLALSRGTAGRSPPDRRPERSPDHNRYAARGRAGLLRWSRCDAGARQPRGHGRSFRLRSCACRDHADVARQHPHRHVSLPAWDPGQQRLSAARGGAHGGDAAEAVGLPDGSVCRRVPGAFTLRTEPGLRSLRRSIRRNARADRVRDAGAPGVRRRAARARVDRAAGGESEAAGSPGSISSIPTRHTVRHRPSTDSTPASRTTARSRRPTRRLHRCSTIFARRIAPRWSSSPAITAKASAITESSRTDCSRTNRRYGSP